MSRAKEFHSSPAPAQLPDLLVASPFHGVLHRFIKSPHLSSRPLYPQHSDIPSLSVKEVRHHICFTLTPVGMECSAPLLLARLVPGETWHRIACALFALSFAQSAVRNHWGRVQDISNGQVRWALESGSHFNQ